MKDFVKQNIAEGAEFIKLMHESGRAMGANFNKPTVELQKLVINEAHAYDKVAVAHALALDDTIEILNAGIDGLAHTFCDVPPTEELIAAYKQRNAWLNPTLAAIGSMTSEGQAIAERFAHDKRAEGKISEKGKKGMCSCMNFCAGIGKVEYAYETVRKLKAAGIDIIWYVLPLDVIF